MSKYHITRLITISALAALFIVVTTTAPSAQPIATESIADDISSREFDSRAAESIMPDGIPLSDPGVIQLGNLTLYNADWIEYSNCLLGISFLFPADGNWTIYEHSNKDKRFEHIGLTNTAQVRGGRINNLVIRFYFLENTSEEATVRTYWKRAKETTLEPPLFRAGEQEATMTGPSESGYLDGLVPAFGRFFHFKEQQLLIQTQEYEESTPNKAASTQLADQVISTLSFNPDCQ